MTQRAMVLDRGRVVHAGESAGLLADRALLDRLVSEAASAISVLSPPKERSGHGFKPL
jgi:hypothetical protein